MGSDHRRDEEQIREFIEFMGGIGGIGIELRIAAYSKQ